MNIFSTSIHDAITFATKVHVNQKRKGKNIPYITHPLSIALILARAHASEEVIIAGILHDTIEDSPEDNRVTKETIAERFGDRVAALVDAVTEQNKSLPWSERKEIALRHIGEMDRDQLLLKSADILHNLSDLVRDVEEQGSTVFEKFNAPKEKKIKQQQSLLKALESTWPENPLIPEIKWRVEKLANTV